MLRNLLTYNANGATSGTVTTDSNTYASGENVPLAGNTGNLTKTGYDFVGWAITADGTAVTSYTMGTGKTITDKLDVAEAGGTVQIDMNSTISEIFYRNTEQY